MGYRGRNLSFILSVELSSRPCVKLELYIITEVVVVVVEGRGLCEERGLAYVK